ncbi:unnamed protein product [marine sediment metagenome]|uniref:Uncharacterized protein n=1 Tax=marine sediment metagenome TaxID=412755 RepID=X0ZDV5_9ZZZZ
MLNKRFSIILGCIIITIFSSNSTYAVGALEWHVEVGDSNTFIYTEVYDSRSIYQDQIVLSEYSLNGQIEIFVTKGTLVSYTITQLMPFSETIYGTRTVNNNISIREEPIIGIVRKTMNNRTYWEGFSIDDPIYSLYQDSLIKTVRFVSLAGEAVPYFQKEITIWDLRTGWMISSSVKVYNADVTYYEVNLELLDREISNKIFNLPNNAIIGLVLFFGIIGILLITRFNHKKHR